MWIAGTAGKMVLEREWSGARASRVNKLVATISAHFPKMLVHGPGRVGPDHFKIKLNFI